MEICTVIRRSYEYEYAEYEQARGLYLVYVKGYAADDCLRMGISRVAVGIYFPFLPFLW